MNRTEDAYNVTWLVRRLFRAMTERANSYLQGTGLTAADRAVLEFLYPDQELTVPEIAKRYHVTRQHVQVTVNSLLDDGLLQSLANPRHKRSPMLRLSQRGRKTFAKVRDQEDVLLNDLFAGIEPADLATTKRTLETLFGHLQEDKDHA
jgi:DNA-binding MarR family transcriptional regulator